MPLLPILTKSQLPFLLSWLSPPPSSCLRPIVRRGRMGWELGRERETDSEKGERKSNKKREEREKLNKILIFGLQHLSVPLQICNGTDTSGIILQHLQNLMASCFLCLVWDMCQIFSIWHISHIYCGCSYSVTLICSSGIVAIVATTFFFFFSQYFICTFFFF